MRLTRGRGFNRGACVRIISRAGVLASSERCRPSLPIRGQRHSSTDYTHAGAVIKLRMKVCSTGTTCGASKLGCY